MTKFGQAEYSDYVAKVFADKLDQFLEEMEKQQFNTRNTEDMYTSFPSSKDVV